MHMFSKEKKFFGGHGIVGAQVPLGTGLSFAQRYRESSGLTVTYMGDGAANQGQVYEAFNMASLWKLPIVYVIENNGYAMGTSVGRATSSKAFHTRGEPWEIPGEQVNGMDVLAVQAAAQRAFGYVRSGKGPYILEVITYRYRGHSMSDPATYRSKEEVEEAKERDPIDHVRGRLLVHPKISEGDLQKIDSWVKEEIKKAVDFAIQSPEPDSSELYTDILIEA